MPLDGQALEQKNSSPDLTTAATRLAQEAYESTSKTCGSLVREGQLFADGVVGGAVLEIKKDPAGTAIRGLATAAGGLGVGALLAAESPVITGCALATAAGLTGKWLHNQIDELSKDDFKNAREIGKAITNTWMIDDPASLRTSINTVQKRVGPLALDVSLMALGFRAAALGARYSPGLIWNLVDVRITPLAPATCSPTGYLGRSPAGEFAFLKNLHGKVRTYKLPLQAMDAEIGGKASGVSRTNLNRRAIDHPPILPAPAAGDRVRGIRSFYFKDRKSR